MADIKDTRSPALRGNGPLIESLPKMSDEEFVLAVLGDEKYKRLERIRVTYESSRNGRKREPARLRILVHTQTVTLLVRITLRRIVAIMAVLASFLGLVIKLVIDHYPQLSQLIQFTG